MENPEAEQLIVEINEILDFLRLNDILSA